MKPLKKKKLSHKLRCYTGISGPGESCNNTRGKISYFFTCVDIVNQLLTRHSPLAPIGQVDERTAKPSRFSIQDSLTELSRIVAVKTLKKSLFLTESEVQTFLEGEKNNIPKEKPKVKYSVTLVLAFLAAENESRQLEGLPLADFGRLPERLLLSVRTKPINESFVN